MTNEQLKTLVGNTDEPAVSILCPLDARRPGNTHDAVLLAQLRERAIDDLSRLATETPASVMADRLSTALDRIDLQHPPAGVAVLVSPTVSRVVPVDGSVEPQVVVGPRFAVAEVLEATARTRTARLVVLSQARTRCVDVTGGEAAERRDFGFPVGTEPPREADTPHRDFPLDEHEPAEAARFVFRAVARALEQVQHADPRLLVLAGTDRDLAYFDEVRDPHDRVAGRITGNHVHETPGALARLAAPVLDAHDRAAADALCAEVREAVGRHAVAGIDETCDAARAGRGHKLVIEVGYRGPDDRAADAIAAVLTHGGDVEIVPKDSLFDLGHVALFTRY
jgi:hypothetical protein